MGLRPFLVMCIVWLAACPPAARADTYAYITNQGADNVVVVDTTTHQKVATITVGHRPAGIAVSPGRSRA